MSASASSRGLIASSRHISDRLARAAARMNDLQWWWTALPDENHIKSYNRL
jgi:hypothetical protein